MISTINYIIRFTYANSYISLFTTTTIAYSKTFAICSPHSTPYLHGKFRTHRYIRQKVGPCKFRAFLHSHYVFTGIDFLRLCPIGIIIPFRTKRIGSSILIICDFCTIKILC